MLLLGFSIFILNAILGIFTIIQKRRIDAVVFGFFAISFGIWTISIYETLATGALFWGRLAFTGAIMGIGFMLLFSIVFPEHKKISLTKIIFILTPTIILTITSFTDTLVTTVSVQNGSISGTFGYMMDFYKFYAPLYILCSIFILTKKYFTLKSINQKNQMRYSLLGTSLFLLPAVITNAVLPLWFNNYSFNNIGPLFSIVMVGFISYAIVRHQLMDIKVIIQRGLIYSVLLASITGVYLLFIFTLEYFFQKSTDVSTFISALITTFFGIFGTPPLKSYFEKITDPIFFKDRYDYAQVLHELSTILNKNLVPKTIISETSLILKNSMKISSIDFNLSSKTKEEGVGVSVPIILNKKKMGSIILGEKLSGDSYNNTDMRLLTTFASQAAVALEKASLYNEVKEYSSSLENKVRERTEKIESIQKEQENMMLEISHGLQTPLTIMKGQLFLLKKQLADSSNIDAIDKSIDRASNFIQRMLNLANLKTTSEAFVVEEVDLNEVVQDIENHFSKELHDKSILFTKNIEKNVSLKAKRDYIEELLSNLINNSIKYIGDKSTKEICLTLTKNNDEAIIILEDTGIGIAKADLNRLFEKFYRIKNDTTRGIKGTGLGLAICKKIVELHNGSIEVESLEGVGTKFIIKFPKKTS